MSKYSELNEFAELESFKCMMCVKRNESNFSRLYSYDVYNINKNSCYYEHECCNCRENGYDNRINGGI